MCAIVVAGGSTPPVGSLALGSTPEQPQVTQGPPLEVSDPLDTLGPAALRAPGGSTPPVLRAELTQAYALAAALMPPACGLRPSALAAMGQVGSRSLVERRLDGGHRVVPPVYGAPESRSGSAGTPDTDHGRLDGDARTDRPVGPLAFLVSTWRSAGVDGDGDGVRDPQDVEDAAVSAAYLLCRDGRDLSTSSGLRAGLLAFSHSAAYAGLVLRWAARFEAATEQEAQATQLLDLLQMASPIPAAVSGQASFSAAAAEARLAPHASSPVATGTSARTADPVAGPTATATAVPTTGATAVPSAHPTPIDHPSASPLPTPVVPAPSPEPPSPTSTPTSTPSLPPAPTCAPSPSPETTPPSVEAAPTATPSAPAAPEPNPPVVTATPSAAPDAPC